MHYGTKETMMDSTHYRQIIINMSVKDNTNEEALEEFDRKIEKFIRDNVDMDIIKDIHVRLN